MSEANSSGFGQFVPGFEFLQNLARQAASGMGAGGGPTASTGLSPLGNWVAPTFSVEDLDKRIQELKAVHFWLDQNSRALSATIQALEVQKMTLATLQGMNVSMGDLSNVLKVKASDALAGMANFGANPSASPAPTAPPSATFAFATPAAPAQPVVQPVANRFAGLEVPAPWQLTAKPQVAAPAAEPAPAAPPPVAQAPAPVKAPGPKPGDGHGGETDAPSPAPAAAGGIDPSLWWGALTQQFQAIAANALKDVGTHSPVEAGNEVAKTLTREAVKAATEITAGLSRSMSGRSVAAPKGKGQTPASAKARAKASAPATAKVAPKAKAKATAKRVVKPVAQPVAKTRTTAPKKTVGKPVVAKSAVKPAPTKKAPAKAGGRAR